MPEETRWNAPGRRMCLWLNCPPVSDASELLIHAKERGLLFAPGRYFYVQAPLPNTLRLGFANLNEKELTRAPQRLPICTRGNANATRGSARRTQPRGVGVSGEPNRCVPN